jgi:prophage antirepressor-like protein
MIMNLQIFENDVFGKIRTVQQENEILFVATDICKALDLQNVSKSVQRLDDDEKGIISSYTLGGNQNLLAVNEFGLYNLVLSSRKPQAKAFKRWVTHDVIPAIRKNGSYSVNQDMRSKEVEARLNNSRARVASTFLKVAQMTDLLEYKHICQQKAAEVLSGVPLLPMQSINENTLSADEVGRELGISGNMVGRIANQHNLKTAEYGKYFYDKSRHCQKQVETFRYYRKVIPVIQSIIDNKKLGA